jgi:hypothetical protein
MALFEAAVVFAVGYVTGAVARLFAGIAAVVALLLVVLGVALPPSLVAVADPVVSLYLGNELLFLSGFLFAIAHDPAGEEE